ncbi:MAG: aspartate carbamoyltransferase, partial [Oscillospiraceae bacterium]|nr:aspartate carbamoyltransferase [Oscillospiraceae bacterium]
SFLRAFSLYSGNNFYLISAPDFKMPEKYTEDLKQNNKIYIREKITDCINELDILYMTRLQRDRIEEKLGRISDDLILDKPKLSGAKNDLMVLHPLPRNEEIDVEVDADERALYFKQAGFGVYIRMALLIMLLENKNKNLPGFTGSDKRCKNSNCITNDKTDTSGLPDLAGQHGVCAYCEHLL